MSTLSDGSVGYLGVCFLGQFGCLRQFSVRVHHRQQHLNVFVLFVRRLGLVRFHLFDLAVANFHQDLLWFLDSEHLSGSGLLHHLLLDDRIVQFGGVNHLRGSEACLGIECVAHELFLEPEVL